MQKSRPESSGSNWLTGRRLFVDRAGDLCNHWWESDQTARVLVTERRSWLRTIGAPSTGNGGSRREREREA